MEFLIFHPTNWVQNGSVLTRAQVARILGKSVATVRRLEGRELFPERDRTGVHRFRQRDAENLRRRIDAGLVQVPFGTALEDYRRSSSRELRQTVEALSDRVEQLESALVELLKTLAS